MADEVAGVGLSKASRLELGGFLHWYGREVEARLGELRIAAKSLGSVGRAEDLDLMTCLADNLSLLTEDSLKIATIQFRLKQPQNRPTSLRNLADTILECFGPESVRVNLPEPRIVMTDPHWIIELIESIAGKRAQLEKSTTGLVDLTLDANESGWGLRINATDELDFSEPSRLAGTLALALGAQLRTEPTVTVLHFPH